MLPSCFPFKAPISPSAPCGVEAFCCIAFIKTGKAIVSTLLVLFESFPVEPATPLIIVFPKSLSNKSKIPAMIIVMF